MGWKEGKKNENYFGGKGALSLCLLTKFQKKVEMLAGLDQSGGRIKKKK